MTDSVPNITMADLDGDQLHLAELIGLENYLKVVQEFGGSAVYIRKLDSLRQGERDREICSKFDGYNFRELAQEYDLSERMVREIVSDHVRAMRSRPVSGQIGFDDLQQNSEGLQSTA